LRAAEDDGDSIVALGDGDGEEEGLVAGAGFAGDGGEATRSKPAVVSVKRVVGERVAKLRLAGPQAYFIRLGLSWACALAAVDK